MLKKIVFLISFYISCLPGIGVCQFSEDFCKFLTLKSDSTTNQDGLQTELEFKPYSQQYTRQNSFYATTSGNTAAFYSRRYVSSPELPDFIPFDYVWLPLFDDISVKFKKGLIGGILEHNGLQQVKLDPKLAFPFKFSFQLHYNAVSLLKMDLTEDNSLR